MRTTMAARIAALQDMTLADLRETYHEVFGEETRSRHKDFLRKRIAWGLQANEEGDLSERARRRAAAPPSSRTTPTSGSASQPGRSTRGPRRRR